MTRTPSHSPHTFAKRLLLCCTLGAASGWVCAQSTPTPPPIAQTQAPVLEQQFERIVHEDGGSRIEEERLGGMTRRIQIQSKLGGLAYEVVPDSGPNKPSPSWNNVKDSAGKALWRVGTF